MSTPLPVPSKVAVTAIRGLIVGTTCSLALITEDRRRRIKNAHNAIQNAERIRSAKNYHAGGAALALAIEEDAALFDPTNVPRSLPVDRWDLGRARSRAVDQKSPSTKRSEPDKPQPGTSDVSRRRADRPVGVDGEDTSKRSTTKTPSRVRLKGHILPQPNRLLTERRTSSVRDAAEEKLRTSATSTRSPFAFPTIQEIRTMIDHAASSKDPQVLQQSLSFVIQALSAQVKGVPLEDSMIDACALLCRTCQKMENYDGARDLLSLVRECGPLSETAYYSFEPLKLLDQIIRKLKFHADRDRLHRESLSRAVDLYCYRLPSDPQVRTDHGFGIGKKLMEMCFAASSLARIEALYWRCNVHRPGDLKFTQWFILQLHEKGEHKTAIKFFCLAFGKQSPTGGRVDQVGDAVVKSVVTAQGYKASAVLRTLDQICSDKRNAAELHSSWVVQLLEAHWVWKHDMDETAALFASLKDRGVSNLVQHPEAVWRVMVEIAYRAGRPELAKSYLDEAMAVHDILPGDHLTALLFAKLKAEAGDWDGVYQDIKGLKVYTNEYMGDRVSRGLVPILKLFAESHTVAETDALVRRYVTELHVPICSHMVTFMANEYAAIRDGESLLAWLEYCAGQGFKVDAAFSNAILSTCRHSWKFPYKDLRNLYLKLRAQGDDYTDEYTERMMADAALSQASPKMEWKGHLKNLMGSSRIPTAKSVVMAGRSYSVQDIILQMKEEIVLRRPQNAVRIYRQAVRQGVELPVQALHLAIKATLAKDGEGIKAALELIRKAEERGVDTSSCNVRIIKAQLDMIDPTMENELKVKAILKVLDDATANGVELSDVVLNQAAHLCLKASNPRLAIKFALMAAKAHGNGSPLCYNSFNFAVVLHASAWKRDLKMLESVISTAKSQLYWTDLLCMKTLKMAERTARGARSPSPEVISILGDALKHCIKARDELRDSGLQLQSGALEIMRAAAEAQKNGNAFEDVLQSKRQDAQEEKASAPEIDQQGLDLVEELLLSKRHDSNAKKASLSSSKRRGARWKDDLEPLADEKGLELFEETLLSQRHGR
ncbi:hypothetical protein CONLIGDRAFT_248224 [Coniochaeta ligniaria NRRL 30616]|uniref:Pentatricopeptide repeat protein n=1 Tax=Coniochaeta ligniaria NRRL 30616 TaxID=1408157 RepID=A0A1J7JF70_9PEZI|nr:hypothetical protein CONLIGDRAFT_248224 [Coniochaeta ligniaria NRRL 30616]